MDVVLECSLDCFVPFEAGLVCFWMVWRWFRGFPRTVPKPLIVSISMVSGS